MEIVLYVLGVAVLGAGVAGVVIPALPGSPLLVAGVVLIAWAEHFERVGVVTIGITVVVALAIQAVDWVAGLLGAKVFGASKWAVIGASIGVVVGLFFGVAGVVLAPVVGAICFEYWRNPDFSRAAKAGLGVFLGFVIGSAVKIALAFVIVGVLAIAVMTG